MNIRWMHASPPTSRLHAVRPSKRTSVCGLPVRKYPGRSSIQTYYFCPDCNRILNTVTIEPKEKK